jgi:hypothetical protein
MDFDEIAKQAEKLAGEHPSEVEQGIGKAAGLLEGAVGHGDEINEGVSKLEGFLGKE